MINWFIGLDRAERVLYFFLAVICVFFATSLDPQALPIILFLVGIPLSRSAGVQEWTLEKIKDKELWQIWAIEVSLVLGTTGLAYLLSPASAFLTIICLSTTAINLFYNSLHYEHDRNSTPGDEVWFKRHYFTNAGIRVVDGILFGYIGLTALVYSIGHGSILVGLFALLALIICGEAISNTITSLASLPKGLRTKYTDIP